MSKPKIVFMGTPEFAIPSLESLLRHHYPIVGVVTQPDRPKGRGQHLIPSPVKILAQSHRFPVMQPERVRNSEFIDLFRQLAPDLVVVAAFGQKLPGELLQIPKMGCINLHPSLLPKYRGAAPINWTLIRGETKTGVTIMMIDEGMDTGDILAQEEMLITADETYGELHGRLAERGASLLLTTIEMILCGTAKQSQQDASGATYAPRLKKEDGLIRWEDDIHHTVNLIRGLSPAPCAYTLFRGKMLKIFSAHADEIPVTEAPGTIGRETEKGLPISAKDGYVYLKEIQMENKKRMSIHDFLRGFRMSPGDTLG
jgi:methionyl-tRNA formyltransferase